MKKFFYSFKVVITLVTFLFILLIITTSSILAQEQTLSQEQTITPETKQEDTETELPPETILATFGEQTITLGEFNELWAQLLEGYGPGLDKISVIDQVISERLLIAEAKNLGLEEDEKVQRQIKDMTEQILVQALIQKEILEKVQVTEEEVTNYYGENQEKFTEKEQVHLYNILLDNEDKAKEILERLKTGEEFEKLAAENSLSPSATKGGDMGYVLKDTLISEIEEVIFNLEINEFSEIIKTDTGFHILRITDKKPQRLKEIEEVRAEIFQTLLYTKQNEAFEKFLADLRSKVNIEINEEFLK